MGMQAHTTIEEIESAGFKVIPVANDANARMVVDKDNCELWYFNCSDNALDTALWFDIGQRSPFAMQKIDWMIRNRICFSCN